MAEMTQSILLTTKKMLGIAEEYHAFDLDIIIHINSVFLSLNQLGVGPIIPFQITGDEEVWSDFVDVAMVPGVQTYVYLKTRLLFDPPTNSFLVGAIEKQIAELEWRMNVQVETPPKEEINDDEDNDTEDSEEPKEPVDPDEPKEPTDPDESTNPEPEPPLPDETYENADTLVETQAFATVSTTTATSVTESRSKNLIDRLKKLKR